jgi:hypothetical protein
MFLVSACLFMASPAFAGPGTPEFWNTDKLTIGVSDNYKLGFEQEFRFAEGSMHYEHSDLGLKRKLFKGLSTSLRYRNVVEFDANGTDMEHRPHWNLSAKVKLFSGLSLKNNVRVEYRIRDQKDNDFRYRDKGTLTWKWGRLASYVSDEVFFEKGEFIRNRLYLGFDGRVSGAVKVGAFYLRRTQEKDDWDATHVFGLKVSVTPDFGPKFTESATGVIAQRGSDNGQALKNRPTGSSTSLAAEPTGL